MSGEQESPKPPADYPLNARMAMVCKDVKISYGMKRDLALPLLAALRDVLLRDGEASVRNLGTFRIVPVRVSCGLGQKQLKDYVTIRFKPSKTLIKEAAAEWSQKTDLLPNVPEKKQWMWTEKKKDTEPGASSSAESAPSAGGEAAAESSVAAVAPDATSTTINTDW